MELNQKLTKSMLRRHSQCGKLGGKKGKAFPQGGVLLGGTALQLTNMTVCKLKSFCIIIMITSRVSVSPQ